MKLVDQIERSRRSDPTPFATPPKPATQSHARAMGRNMEALEDLVWLLNHACPPPTRAGLAVMLRDLADQEREEYGREALLRMAAWAVMCATKLRSTRELHAHNVC